MTAGVEDDPGKLMGFFRWPVLRAATPLREIAQRQEAGPIPLGAAHAAESLQRLLAIIAAGQSPTVADAMALVGDLDAAREALVCAMDNVDVLLDMLSLAGDLVGEL